MITIKINTNNAAFEDGQEISRILKELANKLEQGQQPEKLKDINGNTVGTVKY